MIWLTIIQKEENSYSRLKKNKLIKKENRNNLNFLSIFYFLLMLFQLIPVGLNLSIYIKKSSLFLIKSNLNEIRLIINGTGDQYIINKDFNPCPDIIKLNGNTTNSGQTNCGIINIPLTSSIINTVKIEWNNKLNSLHGLFQNLTNIIEVDLTNFDSSLVTSMTQMF